MNLWRRKVQLIVGAKSFNNEDFEIDFKVEFSDAPEPDISEIAIYNLSDQTIADINSKSSVVLNAGYEGDVGCILLGKTQYTDSYWEGVDKVTKLIIGDGADKWMKYTISKSYKAGITSKQILTDITKMFGIEVGEIALEKDIVYKNGRSVSGMLQNVLKQIVADTGSKVYINKGKITIRPQNKGTITGFLLNADTGLIESPQKVEEEVNGKKIIKYKVKSLLNHKLTTDSIIQIQSKTANGNFRVKKGMHYGDFITECEAIPM